MTSVRCRGWIATLVAAFPLLFVSVHALPPGSTPGELELGAEAAGDLSRSVHLVDDEEALAKIQGMLDEIAAVTERPDIEYRAHLVASPQVNAFVIPGGWVYVTTGLLDSVESDDELAGVMAHEIAHNVNQHAIVRMRNLPKGLGLLQLASLAALIISGSPEAAILAGTAANTITAAVLNGSSVEAEKEADADGILYMTQTRYNPTGFLTFMERLASRSGKFIEEELGIYRTHPLTRERVHAARDRLLEFDVPIRRRLVTDAPQPESRSLVLGGRNLTEVLFEGRRLLLLEGHDEARTRRFLDSVSWTLDHELDESQLKVIPAERGVVLEPEGGPTFFLTPGDGRANGSGEAALAGALRAQLAELVVNERARILANYQLY